MQNVLYAADMMKALSQNLATYQKALIDILDTEIVIHLIQYIKISFLRQFLQVFEVFKMLFILFISLHYKFNSAVYLFDLLFHSLVVNIIDSNLSMLPYN